MDIKKMLASSKKSGMKYFFVEQEEYTGTAFDCLAYNMNYLKNLEYWLQKKWTGAQLQNKNYTVSVER